MEKDHLADAILFLRAALESDAEYGRVSRYDLERALEEVEAEQRSRVTVGQTKNGG